MSVVVPAYNEESRLGGMLEEAVEFLQRNYGDAHGPSVEADKPSTSATHRRANGNNNNNKPHDANGGGAASPDDAASAPLGRRGWEILIVSDGSTDRTVATALQFARDHQLEQYPVPIPGPWWRGHGGREGEKGNSDGSNSNSNNSNNSNNKNKKATHIPHGSIRVVSLAQNRGKGGAVVHGMRHVRGRYVVFADADGASKFADLAQLVSGCREVEDGKGRGVAIGSRAHLVGSEAVVKVRIPIHPRLVLFCVSEKKKAQKRKREK